MSMDGCKHRGPSFPGEPPCLECADAGRTLHYREQKVAIGVRKAEYDLAMTRAGMIMQRGQPWALGARMTDSQVLQYGRAVITSVVALLEAPHPDHFATRLDDEENDAVELMKALIKHIEGAI